jgi:UDP-glucose 4-epimerase
MVGMNCLVLGGTGFIGRHLCDELDHRGYNVTATGLTKADNVKTKSIDFVNIDDFTDLLKGIDIVYHLISTTTPGTSMSDCYHDITSNILPTIRLLESCVKTGVKKVVFLSSGGTVYGSPEYVPIREDHPTNPINPYGIHKLALEKYLNYYYVNYNLDYNVVRLSNPYGKGQNINGNQGVIPIFLARAISGDYIRVWGDGSSIRDYIYISDAIDGIISAAEYYGEEKIFNIGSGKGYSLLDIIQKIEIALNKKIQVLFVNSRKFDVKSNILDIGKAKEILKWHPKVDLEEGLNKTIKYVGDLLKS